MMNQMMILDNHYHRVKIIAKHVTVVPKTFNNAIYVYHRNSFMRNIDTVVLILTHWQCLAPQSTGEPFV